MGGDVWCLDPMATHRWYQSDAVIPIRLDADDVSFWPCGDDVHFKQVLCFNDGSSCTEHFAFSMMDVVPSELNLRTYYEYLVGGYLRKTERTVSLSVNIPNDVAHIAKSFIAHPFLV